MHLVHTTLTMAADESQMWAAMWAEMERQPAEIISNQDMLEAFCENGNHTGVCCTLGESMLDTFVTPNKVERYANNKKKDPKCIHGICKYKCKECNANKWCQFHSGPQGGSIRTNECIVCVYKQAKLSREWRAFKDLWIEAGKQTAKGNTFLERRLKWQMTNYCYETEGDGTVWHQIMYDLKLYV